MQRHLLLLALLSIPVGCASDLDSELGNDGVEDPPEGMVGPDVNSTPREGGGQVSTVDSTDEELWVYFDFETGTQLQLQDPDMDTRWDVAFRRFHIASNGGVSGQGGVEVAVVEQPFDSVTTAPPDGWLEDAPDGDDDNEDPDYVMRDWYDYNFMTHVLTPQDETYVVRTGDGNVFKVAIQDYYDDAGSSGHLTIAWAALEG